MLSIRKIVQDLEDKEGKKPGSPSYFKAVQDTILFHFEVEEKDLSDADAGKLLSEAKNIASKCKQLFDRAQSVKKMLGTKSNTVRSF